MRDIPVFATEFGAASLILKEIPYSQTAYITVHSSQQLQQLLEECTGFCRAAGAEHIYAQGHEELRSYPPFMQVLRMEASKKITEKTDAELTAVSEQTLEQWRDIYNKKMSGIDNASYMTAADAKQMLARGDGYFVKKSGQVLGIVMVSDAKLWALAAMVPGGGREGVLAAAKMFAPRKLSLEVASTNVRAIALYESLGFVKTGVISTWHKIL